MQLSRFRSIPSFRIGIKQNAGRNKSGHITTRHRGGGHKQSIRNIKWNANSSESVIVGFEYDPQRTTPLVKRFDTSINKNKGHFFYKIATEGIKPFQTITTQNVSTQKKGYQLSINSYEPGDFVHSVQLYPGQKATVARAAGSFCQIRSSYSENSKFIETNSNTQYIKIRLPSGSQRLISAKAKAITGIPAFNGYSQKALKKAGQTRWRGWRPSVRGVARNPVDHPHGGGQGKTSGGRPSVTFKAWPTKGQPTRSPKRLNKQILTKRKIKL